MMNNTLGMNEEELDKALSHDQARKDQVREDKLTELEILLSNPDLSNDEISNLLAELIGYSVNKAVCDKIQEIGDKYKINPEQIEFIKNTVAITKDIELFDADSITKNDLIDILLQRLKYTIKNGNINWIDNSKRIVDLIHALRIL